MKFGILPTSILAIFALHTTVLAADVGWPGEVRDALKHAGGNRSELEAALRTVKGKDTEYLIAHASQYDLVNLTCQQIVENVTYARKVHQALPYLGKKLDDGLWREWVLPHRVLDEDLDLWRKDFHERLQPVVQDKKTVREAVEAIHTWLMVKDASGAARIVYGTVNSENRCHTPAQMFKSGGGGCGELSMMCVYLLRAVGIPARHGLMTWHSNTNDQHYYCEYWDPQLSHWVPLDSSDEKPIAEIKTPAEKLKLGIFNSLSFFAHPGFPGVRDIYHTRCLDACLPVTDHLCPIQEVKLEVEAGISGTGTAYVWNLYSCRPVARGGTPGKPGASVLRLADTKKVNRPMLFTVTDGKALYWALQCFTSQTGSVKLKRAVPGECLRWADYGKP